MLSELKDALERFYHYREIFKDLGVCDGFSLPRQHSMKHYLSLIRLFGAPNGVCSSITESKHIVAVKRPWRRSSRFQALGQMLLTNQRLDKLAAARTQFTERGLLDQNFLAEALEMISKSPQFTRVYSSSPAHAELARVRNNLQLDDNENTEDHNNENDNENDGENNTSNLLDNEVSDEPTVLAHVELARTTGLFIFHGIFYISLAY